MQKEFNCDHPQKERAANCFYTEDCGVIYAPEDLLRTDGANVKGAIDDLCTKYRLNFSGASPPVQGQYAHDGWRGPKAGEMTIKIAFPKAVPEEVMKATLKGLIELSWGCNATESYVPPPVQSAPKQPAKYEFGKGKLFVGGLEIGEVTDVKFDIDRIAAEAKERYLMSSAERKTKLDRELAVMELDPDPLQDRDW
jgi:hypothetical protein